MRTRPTFFFAAAAVLSFLACCTGPRKLQGPFEVWERTVITMSDSVMYVFNVNDYRDSVELRYSSKDLSGEDLQSDLFEMLSRKMLATVRSPQQGGVGLAAPQVGLLRRVVAVQRLDQPDEPFVIYPNIRIVEHLGDTVRGPEGCLSVPGRRGIVPRSEGVIISWTDPKTLQTVTEEVHGFTAIIFQHEIDHLDGILYTERADSVWTDPDWEAERAPFAAAGAYDKPAWLNGPGY